jgi:hypothetical protein
MLLTSKKMHACVLRELMLIKASGNFILQVQSRIPSVLTKMNRLFVVQDFHQVSTTGCGESKEIYQ